MPGYPRRRVSVIVATYQLLANREALARPVRPPSTSQHYPLVCHLFANSINLDRLI